MSLYRLVKLGTMDGLNDLQFQCNLRIDSLLKVGDFFLLASILIHLSVHQVLQDLLYDSTTMMKR